MSKKIVNSKKMCQNVSKKIVKKCVKKNLIRKKFVKKIVTKKHTKVGEENHDHFGKANLGS